METRKTLSSFVIEGAMKEDEGPYSITVTNPAGEDKAELFVKIVGQWFFFFTSYFPSFSQSTEQKAVAAAHHQPRNIERNQLKKKIKPFLFITTILFVSLSVTCLSRCARPSGERQVYIGRRGHGHHHMGPPLVRWWSFCQRYS